ncbi:hypothetical protein [Parendozoicomonas sp. Alg238-R29]|uniref:hypothetical protein n=1 Tax=Parendozoicomonas sp. Alg238-R29 TaxID=2993446 RepID=UPI00248D5134|nr:hypothetical protein [Parendozoicomonas sp. Alg238-R29]
MLGNTTTRHRLSDSQLPQQNLDSQNTNRNPCNKTSALVKVDDYAFFKPLMSRRSKINKFLQIYCNNLKQDFSDYFKTSFFLPLAAISGTTIATASSIYLGVISGGWRPKLIIPTLLATQVVVPHGIIGGLALGTTALTAGILIKSLIRTVKIVYMSPDERLLASCRDAYKTLKSLIEKEFQICKALSENDIQRKSHLGTFLENRKPACQSILDTKEATESEYQELGLSTAQSNQEHLGSLATNIVTETTV